jgi:uncharacterized protein YecE (DUF72 family)
MAEPQLLIGTSGWTYASWRGRFYPRDMPSGEYLAFYAKEFVTTEINYSFYQLPRPETFAKWAEQVPADFIFAVKASRFISHTKRLKEIEEAWTRFVTNAEQLGSHLGPILLQFPQSFRCDVPRLTAFLEYARTAGPKLRLVFEFRHESWFKKAVYEALHRHAAALCIADSSRYPRHDIITSDFVYVRFHGPARLFGSRYPRRQLTLEARKIGQWLKTGLAVYVYFNNDALGHAVVNARELRSLSKQVRGEA